MQHLEAPLIAVPGRVALQVVALAVTCLLLSRHNLARWLARRHRSIRAALMIVLFLVLLLQLTVLGVTLNLFLVERLPGLSMVLREETLAALSTRPGAAVAIVIAVALLARWLRSVSLESCGLLPREGARFDAVLGWLVAPILFGVMLLVSLAKAWVDVQPAGGPLYALGVVLGGLVLFFTVAVNEELLFRGFLLNTVTRGFGLPAGIIVSSLLFALAHAGNPGAGSAALAGIFLAGLLFAYAYVLTRQLWLPIGFHWAWDFSETSVYGFPDSGMAPYSLLHLDIHGPDAWLGGAFGPEAGLLSIVAILAAALVFHLYGRWRGLTVGPPEEAAGEAAVV